MATAIENLEAIDARDAAMVLAADTHNKHIGEDRVLVCDPKTGEVRTRKGGECSEEEYYQKRGAESIFALAGHPGYSCENCNGEDDECDNLSFTPEVVEQIEQAIEARIQELRAETEQAE